MEMIVEILTNGHGHLHINLIQMLRKTCQ